MQECYRVCVSDDSSPALCAGLTSGGWLCIDANPFSATRQAKPNPSFPPLLLSFAFTLSISKVLTVSQARLSDDLLTIIAIISL